MKNYTFVEAMPLINLCRDIYRMDRAHIEKHYKEAFCAELIMICSIVAYYDAREDHQGLNIVLGLVERALPYIKYAHSICTKALEQE